MDSLSFEELLHALSAKHEKLRLEYIKLAATSPRAIPKRVEQPHAMLTDKSWFWETDFPLSTPRLEYECCQDSELACVGQTIDPDRRNPTWDLLPVCGGASSSVRSDMASAIAPGIESAVLISTSSTMPKATKHEKHFRRLDRDDSGFLTAAKCLQIMEDLQSCGRFEHSLPSVEQLADDIEGFCGDIPQTCSSQRTDGHLGLDMQSFVHLMSRDKPCRHHLVFQGTQQRIKLLQLAFHEERKVWSMLQAEEVFEKEVPPPLESVTRNGLDIVSGVMLFLNALVMGLSSDWDPDAVSWMYIEAGFAAFFTCEMLYNIVSAGSRTFFCGEAWGWNWFDMVLVSAALFDIVFTAVHRARGGGRTNTGSLTLIRMARFGRLARLVRILRFKIFQELKTMVYGVIAGLRVLFWAIVLLVFFIFLAGVIMRRTVGSSENPEHEYATRQAFETVPMAMFTLFRCFTDGCSAYDGTPLQVHLYGYFGSGFTVAYMLTYLFVTLGIFNLIMALFIDNVMEASLHRRKAELGANAERMERKLEGLIYKLIGKTPQANGLSPPPSRVLESITDSIRNSQIFGLCQQSQEQKACLQRLNRSVSECEFVISKELFVKWVSEPEIVNLLAELDISVSDKAELFEVLDTDLSGVLEVPELISGLMKLRGPTDKCDAVAALLGVRHLTRLMDHMHEMPAPRG